MPITEPIWASLKEPAHTPCPERGKLPLTCNLEPEMPGYKVLLEEMGSNLRAPPLHQMDILDLPSPVPSQPLRLLPSGEGQSCHSEADAIQRSYFSQVIQVPSESHFNI